MKSLPSIREKEETDEKNLVPSINTLIEFLHFVKVSLH
jgi:hypothetical protein